MSRLVLCSTGAITRDPDRTDHSEIVAHGPALGVPGFELAIYRTWYGHLDDVVSDLREANLSFPVVHAEKGIGAGLGSDDGDDADAALERLEVNCRAAAALGAKTLVVHLWERPTGDKTFERNLARLPACVDTAAAYGLTLAVETIPGDAATALANVRQALEREPRCRVTLDTEFLGFHGQLEESIAADWLWSEPFVHHVHLKDFDGRLRTGDVRHYRLPGEGSLDLQGFLTGLVERSFSGSITVESSAVTADGKLDESRLQQIADVVRQLAS